MKVSRKDPKIFEIFRSWICGDHQSNCVSIWDPGVTSGMLIMILNFRKIPKNTRFSRNSCLNKVMHTGSNFEIFAPAVIHCFTFCTLFEDFSGLDSWLKTFYRIYHSLHDHSNGNARRRKWCNRNEKPILTENVLYRIKRWSLYSKSMHFG